MDKEIKVGDTVRIIREISSDEWPGDKTLKIGTRAKVTNVMHKYPDTIYIRLFNSKAGHLKRCFEKVSKNKLWRM